MKVLGPFTGLYTTITEFADASYEIVDGDLIITIVINRYVLPKSFDVIRETGAA